MQNAQDSWAEEMQIAAFGLKIEIFQAFSSVFIVSFLSLCIYSIKISMCIYPDTKKMMVCVK